MRLIFAVRLIGCKLNCGGFAPLCHGQVCCSVVVSAIPGEKRITFQLESEFWGFVCRAQKSLLITH
jgi:hypothetical protein